MINNPNAFARLISQITYIANTHSMGGALSETQIRDIAATLEQIAGAHNAQFATVNDLLGAMLAHRKIDAIKTYRTITGVGLKDAKDAVERYWPFNAVAPPRQSSPWADDNNDEPF